MSEELETFLASLGYASRSNGANIGGGDFSAEQLAVIVKEIKELISIKDKS